MLEAALQGKTWLVGGAFSAADIMVGSSVRYLHSLRLLDRQRFPNLAAYLHRVQQRPAYKAAFTVGGGKADGGGTGSAGSGVGLEGGTSIVSRL